VFKRRAGSTAPNHLLRVVALLMALAFVAAACGGGDDDDNAAPSGTEQASEEGTPTPGGTMKVGIEAEVDGFDPTANRFPVAGLIYAAAVFDPLTIFDADNKAQPYLAKSITPNADFTVWTIGLRDGIKFHDGEPLDANAVKINLDGHKASAQNGPALANLATVTVKDPLTVELQMKAPWSQFAGYLTGQLGFVAAPKMLADKANGSRNPIGTGPFVFKEWIPGQRFVATKNPNYWRQGLPYLDGIEIRPIIEPQTRENALVSGEIDIMHTTETQSIVNMRANDSIKLTEITKGELEEQFTLLNTATEPFNNLNARKALAYATNQQQLIDTAYNGILKPVDSPFSAGESEWAADVPYPKYDLDSAKKAVAAYKADTGKDLSFQYGTTNNAKSLQVAQLLQDMWGQAGMKVSVTQVEQSQYILNALLGKHQAYSWRQYGAPLPDLEYVWWASTSAAPPGSLAINFSRFTDPEVDRLMVDARATQDVAKQKEDYAGVAKIFAEQLPFVYQTSTQWDIAYKPTVHGVDTFPLPDQDPSEKGGGNPLAGVIRLTNLWIEQ